MYSGKCGFIVEIFLAGGVGILNNHARSRQPKGFVSKKSQWPALSIEGIIELPFKFWRVLDGYGGGRTVPYITHWDSYGLRTLSVPRKYVFVASFKPDDDLIIFRGANAECAKTIPAMLFLPVPPWTVRKKKLNGNKLFPVRLSACGTASWPFRFFFSFSSFFLCFRFSSRGGWVGYEPTIDWGGCQIQRYQSWVYWPLIEQVLNYIEVNIPGSRVY